METGGSGRGVSSERTISDLMTPPSAYRRVYEDEPVSRVVRVLMQSLFPPGNAGRRSVLVYSRKGAFLGCIRLNDILELLAPGDSPEGVPFRPGMLAARSRLIGSMTAGEVLGEQRFIDIDTPLLEAVRIMVLDGLINIPVLRRGELVGVLVDKSVLREIGEHVAGGGSGGVTELAARAVRKGLPRATALSGRHRRGGAAGARGAPAGAARAV